MPATNVLCGLLYVILTNPYVEGQQIFFVWGHPDSSSFLVANITPDFYFLSKDVPCTLEETDPVLKPRISSSSLKPISKSLAAGMIMWYSLDLLGHRRNFLEDPESSIEMSQKRHFLLTKYECGSMDTIEGSQLWVKVASKKKVKKIEIRTLFISLSSEWD